MFRVKGQLKNVKWKHPTLLFLILKNLEKQNQ